MELYEGKERWTPAGGQFSSLWGARCPGVERQAYILPATPLAATHTRTERALADTHLLCECLNQIHIFYTRVAPSKTFDLLKEDFDYNLITIVLVALIVATYSTKYFASRKMLKMAWK
ncbi:unnamed protein product [Leptidea sinapis]|uniref:ER membrane protein complex subunit 1 n=1 Tax=Leptidea sinapis TaxID=189913 RepID=A0A5E4PUJ0_9NEOP|nr:unnamed protein product [Leptidea sinapis]